MTAVRVLSLPCVDEKAVEECATWFRGAELELKVPCSVVATMAARFERTTANASEAADA